MIPVFPIGLRRRGRSVMRFVRREIFQPVLHWLGGLLFDLYAQPYRAEGLVFAIPHELTTRRFRGRFPLDLYESEERKMIRQLPPPADAQVLELGGCIGVVSCLTNRHLARKEAHVVLEPNPQLTPWIELNRARNNAGFKVIQALASKSSNGSFYLHDLIVGGSAHRATGTSITVPVVTVEQIEAATGLRFDAIVMDIEGGELDFLTENPALLARLRWVCAELHPQIIGTEAVARCRELLRAAGLECRLVAHQSEIWTRASA